jgi:hypothetical protein
MSRRPTRTISWIPGGWTLSLGYAESLYRQWIVDLDEMEPEALERSLTKGVRLLRRATLLNTKHPGAAPQAIGVGRS